MRPCRIKLFSQSLAIGIVSIFSVGGAVSAQDVVKVDFAATKVPEVACTKIIPLETRKDALLDDHYHLHSTSRYYVAQDKTKIVVFDKSGKIHTVISPIGRGPNEVVSLLDIWPDENSIKIHDAYNNRILEYDYSGKFAGELKLTNRPTEICVFNGGYLFDFQSGGLGNGNVLAICDSKGGVIKSQIELVGENVIYGAEKFQKRPDGMMYLPSHSNTVYRVDGSNGIKARYAFDFGRHWAKKDIVDDFKNPVNAYDLWEYLKGKGMIGFLKFKETDSVISLNFERVDEVCNWFYDKRNGKQYMVGTNNNTRSVAGSRILYAEGDSFIFEIPAFKYGEHKNLPRLNVDESDNPILVVGNLT